MNLKGKIKSIGQPKTFDSGFSVRECVVTTDDKYPQDILVKFFKDKIEKLSSYKAGDMVDISINLRGNSYNDKGGNTRYNTDIVGWNIQALETTNSQQQPDRDLPF
jgi:single-stranded DNA-binding protein